MTDILQQGQTGGNAVAAKHVTFLYNGRGQITNISRYESTGTSNHVVDSTLDYDYLGRLTELTHGSLAGYSYVYDAASRITSVDSLLDGLTSYSYDDTNQLLSADNASPRVDESYSYDKNGNRTMSGYTVTTNNRISTDGAYNYAYDDEGNLASKTNISTGEVEEYTWDYRNRLTKVTFKDSLGNVVKTVENTYDAFDRWIKRSYDSDGPGSTAAVDTYFSFEGDSINPVLEFSGTVTPTLTHRYLWGPLVNQILADEQVTSTSSAGNILWGLTDNLGSVRDIADFNATTQTTTITNHRVYDSFGRLTSASNSSVNLLFGYTGKALDEVTGLQNYLHRWYDAQIGQWMSEDPIGFAGGTPNLGEYAENSPTNLTDPFGLFTWREYWVSVPPTTAWRWWRGASSGGRMPRYAEDAAARRSRCQASGRRRGRSAAEAVGS